MNKKIIFSMLGLFIVGFILYKSKNGGFTINTGKYTDTWDI